LKPVAGQTVLDLGCGTGDLARFLNPDSLYIGVDNNAAYLSVSESTDLSAQFGRFFVNADLASLEDLELPAADAAIALGVLHHLSDPQVLNLLRAVRKFLKPGGSLVTVDPVFVPDQAASARVMMALDRGRYVRHIEHYKFLFEEACQGAEVYVRDDINPFPYNIIFVGTN
jgi:SAM-dependent methyltransferase